MFLRFQNVHQMSPHTSITGTDDSYTYTYIYIYLLLIMRGNALRAGCARSKAPLGSYLGQGLIPGSPFLPGCYPRHHNGRCLALYVVELLVHNQKTSQVRVIRSLNLSLSLNMYMKNLVTQYSSQQIARLCHKAHTSVVVEFSADTCCCLSNS